MSDEVIGYEAQIAFLCDTCGGEDGFHLPLCPYHVDWEDPFVDADEFYVDPQGTYFIDEGIEG